MKYMITFKHIDGEWDRLTARERAQHQETLQQFVSDLSEVKQSRLVFFDDSASKTISLARDGTVSVSESIAPVERERVGGYYIVDVETEAEAVEWAKRGRFMPGSNELRRIVE